MNNQYKNLLKIILLPLISISYQTHAAEWITEAGMHTGGSKFTNTTLSNNTFYSGRAGELMTLAIGSQIKISENSNVRVLFGWKFNSMSSMHSSTDNINFSRFPIDVLYFQRLKKWNFGGGLSYHLNPKLTGDGINKNYDNALGYIVEIDFRLTDFFYLGGKYTDIAYKQKSNSITVDGNSIGIVGGFIFSG